MKRRPTPKTHEQVRKEFRDAGITIREWARDHGFSERMVYTVLCDGRPGVRGESYRIAVALGLKLPVGRVGA